MRRKIVSGDIALSKMNQDYRPAMIGSIVLLGFHNSEMINLASLEIFGFKLLPGDLSGIGQ